MSFSSADLNHFKKQAACKAVDLIQSGMTLGLGTGSTVEHFIYALAQRVRQGLAISGIPTSEATRRLAQEQGIPLTSFEVVSELDLTVDGADEITAKLQLIKGGGAALLYEKIVAYASKRVVIVADISKVVTFLGRFPLPIEVAPFGWQSTKRALERYLQELFHLAHDQAYERVRLRYRYHGDIWITDGGHYILDVECSSLADPEPVAARLEAIPGVLGHGLFLAIAHEALIGGPDGVQHLYAGACLHKT
jgi:ribose 5-phosphate isomerase A